MKWVTNKRGTNEIKKGLAGEAEKCKKGYSKVIMQGKLFQRCTNLLYCIVLSLGGNLSTRRISEPDMGSILYIKKTRKATWS